MSPPVPGKVVFRKMRNLKPGQVVWPPAWRGDEDDDGKQNEWAWVVGHPMIFELQHRVFKDIRRVCQVAARYDHAEESFCIQDHPNQDVRVIIPKETKTE